MNKLSFKEPPNPLREGLFKEKLFIKKSFCLGQKKQSKEMNGEDAVRSKNSFDSVWINKNGMKHQA